MRTVAIIQARMGSTRLPGKVMLPLNGEHVLTHDIRRTKAAETVDDVVVATSTKTADDIIARYAKNAGAKVFRGSESNVLKRMYQASKRENAEIIVRITADCPLIAPDVIDEVVEQLIETDADYSANILERTFPRGLDAEAFTFKSFRRVYQEANDPVYREHVTPYYHERDDLFSSVSLTSEDMFDDPQMQNRTDIRITLDEADDYELLRQIYYGLECSEIIGVSDIVTYVDDNNLTTVNENVEQKSHSDTEDNP